MKIKLDDLTVWNERVVRLSCYYLKITITRFISNTASQIRTIIADCMIGLKRGMDCGLLMNTDGWDRKRDRKYVYESG